MQKQSGTQKSRPPMRVALVAVIVMDWKKGGEQNRGMRGRRLLQLPRGERMGSGIREWQRKSSYVVVFQVSFEDRTNMIC